MTRWQQVVEWIKPIRPVAGAEIGVKEGRFIEFLLQRYPKLIMIAVDPWEYQPDGNETYQEWNLENIYGQYRAKVKPYIERVRELKQYSADAVHNVPDGSLDFVFIDAQHDYDSVKNDIEIWTPKIRPGGLLCGHDYQPRFTGVIKAVHEACDPILGGNDTWAKWIS